MDEITQRPSPWWYRHRASTIAVIYWLSFYPAFGVANALHASTDPLVTFFGPAHVRAVLSIGVILALAGWLLRAWGTEYLRPDVVWHRDARTDRFFIAGPFRYTRNPLYLGNLFVAAAIALFVPPIGWPIVMLAQWIFVRALIAEEERRLRARYGAEFERYCLEVPRLVPRLVPVAGEAAGHTKLLRAMVSEALAGGFVLALATLAAFGLGAWRYALAVVAIGVLAQALRRSADGAAAGADSGLP